MPLPARQRVADSRSRELSRQEESWRNFGYNNEAGRLLHRLYGGNSNYKKVNYPKLRHKSEQALRQEEESKRSWYAGNANQVDPREKSDRQKREQSVLIPKVQQKKTRPIAPIEYIAKRKAKSEIEKEVNNINQEMSNYRPLPRPAISTETEKRRLALANQFKGGKALPASGTLKAIEGNVPLHLITQKVNKNLIRTVEDAQRAKAEREAANRQKEKELLEADFEIAHSEIKEIKGKLEQLENKHQHARAIGNLKQKLRERIAELERIDELLLDLEKRG